MEDAKLLEMMRACQEKCCQFASMNPERERGVCDGWAQAIECLAALTNQGPISKIISLVVAEVMTKK